MMEDCSVCREVDQREDLRLEVVAVACEVVTLEVRIIEDAQEAGDVAHALVAEAQELATRARAVISPSTDFDALGDSVLRAALAVLREDAVGIRKLRVRLAQLIGPAPDIEVG